MSDAIVAEREALQQRFSILREDYDALSRQIENIADAGIERRLKRQTNDLLEEMQQLEAQLEDLQQQEVGNKIYQALLSLNYEAQARLFFPLANAHPLIALLVQGPNEFGQRWLVNRLLRKYASGKRRPPFRFDLTRLSRGNSAADIWRELRVEFDLPRSATPQQVAERICDCWKTAHVLFFFDCLLDLMPDQALASFVNDFWAPLLEVAQARPASAGGYRLLLFFIDSSGCTRAQPLAFAEANDPALVPRSVVRLPPLTRFSADDLTNWVNKLEAIEYLPDLPTRVEVQAILDRSDNGVPERAFDEICYLYDYEWLRGMKQWPNIY